LINYKFVILSEAKDLFAGKQKILRFAQNDKRIVNSPYYETTTEIRDAIAREKQMKGWLRIKKIIFIEESNPGWDDLSLSWRI